MGVVPVVLTRVLTRVLLLAGALEPVVAAADGRPGGFIHHACERAGEFGLAKRRQEAPRAHSVAVTADGRFADDPFH